MADDKSTTGPADALRVRGPVLGQKFGCMKAELEGSVKAVGGMAKDVKQLRKM